MIRVGGGDGKKPNRGDVHAPDPYQSRSGRG
jgi:hypothetical protein